MIESVMVDAVEYRVEETDEKIIIEGQQCVADVDYNSALIRIGNVVGEGAKAKVLMHEIFHALLSERGLGAESQNEMLVNELASGTINLIRDNPALVEFIISA